MGHAEANFHSRLILVVVENRDSNRSLLKPPHQRGHYTGLLKLAFCRCGLSPADSDSDAFHPRFHIDASNGQEGDVQALCGAADRRKVDQEGALFTRFNAELFIPAVGCG